MTGPDAATKARHVSILKLLNHTTNREQRQLWEPHGDRCGGESPPHATLHCIHENKKRVDKPLASPLTVLLSVHSREHLKLPVPGEERKRGRVAGPVRACVLSEVEICAPSAPLARDLFVTVTLLSF